MNLKRTEVENCIAQAFATLQQHVRKDGSETGWHQHLGSSKIGNVATAQALLVSDYLGSPIIEKDAALNTLVNRQKFNSGDIRINGGWTFVTNGTAQPTTEATVWGVLATSTDIVNRRASVDAGADWLLANRITHNGRQVWGSTVVDQARVYTTALAIRALCACNREGTVQSAVEWLLAHQNSDGGWGASVGSKSTMVHTAHAVIALKEVGSSNAKRAITIASDWLLSRYIKESYWNTNDSHELLEEVDLASISPGGPGGGRITFYHFSAPWVVSALINAGRAMEPKVIRAIKGLVDSAEHGYWYHPHQKGGGNKTSWAIHDCLFALSSFEKAIPNFQSIDEFVDKGNRFDVTISGSRPVGWNQFKSFPKNLKWWLFGAIMAITFILWASGVIKTESGIGVALVQFIVAVLVALFERLK